MSSMATVSLRMASARAIGQPHAAPREMPSAGTLISPLRYFIGITDWDEKYLYRRVIDKIFIGVVILSILYLCFRPGAYLTEILLGNSGP